MSTEDKVTEIFVMANEFCKVLETLGAAKQKFKQAQFCFALDFHDF